MASSLPTPVLRVRLAGVTLGLPANAVREIVRAVAITALPSAPRIVEGVVNVRGELVPVVDLRWRLGLPAQAADPDEFLVLVLAGSRTVALRVDDVDDITELATSELDAPETVTPALRGVAGIAAQPDGALLLYDPLAFVNQAEASALEASMGGA